MAGRERGQGIAAVPLGGAGAGWSMALLFAGGLWVLTVNQARGMGVGPGTMGMALPLFTGTWVAMMGAMMLPAIAPAAILSTGTTTQRRAGRRASLAVAHMIGFFVPWAVYGMAAFVALVGVEHLVDASPVRARWLGVAILAAAGLYQFSPWKHRCMAHCRMDMANAGNGIRAAFASGIGHGSACVGCCWALMTIMFAVGVMNVPAMIGLASVIFLEKLWRRGPLLARLAGGAFLVVALVAAAHPATLGGLRPGDMVMPAAPITAPNAGYDVPGPAA